MAARNYLVEIVYKDESLGKSILANNNQREIHIKNGNMVKGGMTKNKANQEAKLIYNQFPDVIKYAKVIQWK